MLKNSKSFYFTKRQIFCFLHDKVIYKKSDYSVLHSSLQLFIYIH